MASAARNYECPACGGSVDERARACNYCGIALGTVRCSVCFHMNTVDALHCSGCGFELGLEPFTDPAKLVCPTCRIPFDQYGGEAGSLFDCSGCGGQFVQHALLKDLLRRQQVYVLQAARPRRLSLREPVVYRPCPSCQTMMNRQNFGKSSGVIVDVCTRHGVWFDAGELPRVIEFVRSGGLARAEEAERETRKRAARAAALPVPNIDQLRPTALDLGPTPSAYGGLAQAVRELLGFVAKL